MTVTRGIGIHDPGVEMLDHPVWCRAAYRSSPSMSCIPARRSDGPESGCSAAVGGRFYAMPVTAVHQLEESCAGAVARRRSGGGSHGRPPSSRRPSGALCLAGVAALGGSTAPAPSSHRFVGVFVLLVAAASAPGHASDNSRPGGLALVVVLQVQPPPSSPEWVFIRPATRGSGPPAADCIPSDFFCTLVFFVFFRFLLVFMI